MNLTPSLWKDSIHLSTDEVKQLRNPATQGYTVEIQPPRNTKLPATIPDVVKGITEFQTRLLGIRNRSPTVAFEIRREQKQDLRLQFTVPTKRLERKLRTNLSNSIPEIGFGDGNTGLPVTEDIAVGGGLLTPGRLDFHSLRTEFDSPPTNPLIAALHQHAMQNTQVIIQLLFTPVAGQPVRNWWWKRKAYRRRNYLRKEKEKLWGNRSPTKREREQARQVDRKASTGRFKTALRFLFIGSGEHTPSRVKELAGAFNIYENPDTGQYLNPVTVRSLRRKPILRFAQAVADRQYRGWSRSFRTTSDELAALTSVPSRSQDNINHATP